MTTEEVENLNRYKEFIRLWKSSDINEIECITSGSTGIPKRILLSKEVIRESALRTIRYFGIDKTWTLATCISSKYIGGKMMAVRAIESGAGLLCVPPSNTPDLTEVFSREGCALIAVVPSQMWHVLEYPFSDSSHRCIHFLIGGSALPDELRREIIARGLSAVETYGMTETSSHIALRKITQEDSGFRPLPGVVLSTSDNGRLIIDNVTRESIVTNDLVEFDNDGYFRILGRADNVIITGGLKVIPELLESKIKKLLKEAPFADEIKDVMITSAPDTKWGEAIRLIIESKDSDPELADEVQKYLKHFKGEGLEKHEIPKTYMVVTNLPRTQNGKLKRREQI